LIVIEGIGLYFFFQKDKLLAGILSVIFLFQLYINSALYSKLTGVYAYQYSSFGGRMFLSCIPIFILGLAGLAEALRSKIDRSPLALLTAFLILWNLGFILQFGLGLIPREGNISWRAVAYNQFVTIPSLIYRKIHCQGLLWGIIFFMTAFYIYVSYLKRRE